jgi:hypothetical protein
MSRGESNHRMRTATENIAVLRKMKNRHILTEPDTYILRDLAFTYGGREMAYHDVIDHLITALTPKAISERLLS